MTADEHVAAAKKLVLEAVGHLSQAMQTCGGWPVEKKNDLVYASSKLREVADDTWFTTGSLLSRIGRRP